MSGTSTSYPFPIYSGRLPPEGGKGVPFRYSWGSGFTAQVNLLSAFNSGQFTTVQGVFVDNSTCACSIQLTGGQENEVVNVPPFAAGVYPLFSAEAPIYNITATPIAVTGSTGSFLTFPNNSYGSTKFIFLNMPQAPWEQRRGAWTPMSCSYWYSGTKRDFPMLGASPGGLVAVHGFTLSVGLITANGATEQDIIIELAGTAGQLGVWADGWFIPANQPAGSVSTYRPTFDPPLLIPWQYCGFYFGYHSSGTTPPLNFAATINASAVPLS